MCCEVKDRSGQTPGEQVSIENVGGGVELYRDGTGPDPFELRTLTSTTLELTQNANTVSAEFELENLSATGCAIWNGQYGPAGFKSLYADPTQGISLSCEADRIRIVNLRGDATCANVGAGSQVYVTGSTGPFNFRTIRSSDSTVQVTQNATDIDLKVSGLSTVEGYYSSKNDIVTTNGTAYVVVSVMDAIANGNTGESWVLVCSVAVCHPPGLTTVNTRLRWDIETSTNVWATMETDLNVCEPITIAAGQRSSPRTRTYNPTLAMNAPRVRCLMSMSAAVATGGEVEFAQVSGYRRTV
jgi:hypothetical protein